LSWNSPTVEALLSDVKRLVIRLQRHDAAAETLIDQAEALKKKTESQASFPPDPDEAEFSNADSNEDGMRTHWGDDREEEHLVLPAGQSQGEGEEESSCNGFQYRADYLRD
jgi:hypothetical protein